MITFNNMTDYTEWITNEGSKLDKYDMRMVYVESIKKNFCVCGTPLAVEPALEESGNALIKAWTKGLAEKAKVKGEENIDIIEDDLDVISQMRDAAYEIVEKYLNMEIVFISTEY